MFKRVLASISKSLHRTATPPPEAPPPEPPPKQAAKPVTAAPVVGKSGPKKKNEVPTEAPKAGQPKAAEPKAPEPKSAPLTPTAPMKSPEELCGINPKMSKEEIRDQLKVLYRRFNQAASSLNNATRAQADVMLDAIVAVREKHFGAI